MNVLICDDSGFARKQLARALPADWKVDLHYAANGLEGIEQVLMGHGDLIFLDLTMPEMDGYEATALIRSGSVPGVNPNIPVVALTAHAMVGEDKKCLDAGMNDYLTKPLDRAKLIEVLGKYLQKA